MLLSRFLIPCLCLFVVGAPSISLGQSAEDAKALKDQASTQFDSGNYEQASKFLKEYLGKYSKNPDAPTIRYLLGLAQYYLGNYEETVKLLTDTNGIPKEMLPNAWFHLGVSLYYTGKYDAAIPVLQKAATGENKDIVPYALFYIARSNVEKGSAQDETKPDEAKKTWKAAIDALTSLISAYPDNDLIPDAYMSRASTYVFLGQYAEAQKDLETLRSRNDSKAMSDDVDFLLGYVLAQQAQKLQEAFKSDEASQVISQAKETYNRLAASPNLIIANQAAFQLANLDFADKKYEDAIAAYRAVRSKKELIESQEKRLTALREEISKNAGNKAQLAALQRSLTREDQKMAAVKNNPELALEALIRIGDCMLQLARYDESRIIYHFAAQFAPDEQQKQLALQVIISFAIQGLAEPAEKAFAEFRQKYPNDPLAESVDFLIGSALLQQQRYEEAIAKFDKSLQSFPQSRVAAQIPKLKAQALLALNKPEEALKSFETFIQDAQSGKIKVSPEVIDDTRRLRALSLYRMQKVDEAIAAMTELSQNASTAAIKEDAAYQAGNLLFAAGKYAEAATAYSQFAATFPDSPNAVRAAFQVSTCYEKLNKTDEALAANKAFAEKYPDSELRVFALEKIWKIYLSQNKYDDAVKAQDELITAYPDSDRALVALYERAKYLEEKAKKPDDALAAYLQVYETYQKLPESAKTPSADGKASNAANITAVCLVRASEILRKQASGMGRYVILDPAGKEKWNGRITGAEKNLDIAIKQFTTSSAFSFALQKMVDIQLLKIGAGLSTLNDSATYFSTLAGTLDDEAARIQVLVARASLSYQAGQPAQALAFYKEAFSKVSNPKKLSWQDYDRFGAALLDAKEWDEADKIFSTLQENFPQPPQAQASAVYGLGATAQGKGDLAKAEGYFEKLKKDYPWSEKIMDAEYGRALALKSQDKYDEMFAALKPIMSGQRSSNEIKAKSMLLFGTTLAEIADKGGTTAETKQPNGKPDLDLRDLAANYFIKTDLYYENQPLIASEALYRAAEIRKKQGKTKELSQLVDELSTKYPSSPWVPKGQELMR